MKRLIFITVLFLMLFGFNKQVNSQSCPSPSVLTSLVLDIPECPDLTAVFCLYCDPTQASMEFMLVGLENVCDVTLYDYYFDYAFDYIQVNYATICPGVWTPCEQPERTEVKIKKPMCYYYDDKDPVNFHICDSTYCVHTYDVCTDLYGYTIWTFISNSIEGVGCPDVVFPDQVGPYECGRTDCFGL